VKTFARLLSPAFRNGNSIGLIVLFLVLVLMPSIGLLWFMGQAARNERLAVRQKLVNAYQAHLAMAQERLDAYWQNLARDLDEQADRLPPASLFAKLVRAGLADAVICFDRAGNVVYPSAGLWVRAEISDPRWSEAERLEPGDPAAAAAAYDALFRNTTNATLAARALQAQARCLLQAGDKPAAAAILTEALASDRFRHATDLQGRLIGPSARLMAIELLKESEPDKARLLFDQLKADLLDYDHVTMPAPQRCFIMRETQRLFPGQAHFPMLAAEDLAGRYLAEAGLETAEPSLRATAVPGTVQFGSARGRVTTLHQAENLAARMRATIASQTLPTDARLELVPPGQEAESALLSQPAAPALPGWRLALSLKDQGLFDAAASHRVASYTWIGALVVALVSLVALLAFGLARRQIALTQLRNDLVANVTHELKTPLSSMRLLVDTLIDAKELHEQTAREYLHLIAVENARLSRLIDNFLTFSRIERNKYPFDFREVPAAEILDTAAATVRERFQMPGCHFEVRRPPDLPRIKADPDALVTALINLLDNAWKYSGEKKEIVLAATEDNGHVRFEVRDNGIGLSPREAKRVFERFYRVDHRSTGSPTGFGLGLSIVKFIVAAHRGTVEVTSEPGGGSTFGLLLPATPARTAPETAERTVSLN
jgi:signal transduction histidine kinase